MSDAGMGPYPQNKTRVLVIEERGDGMDPVVQEVEDPRSIVDNANTRTAGTLHRWMEDNEQCPCGPRKCAEGDLAHKVEELARSNRDLEQFAYVVSHDLQEPLRMVAAYTQLLAERYRGRSDETAERYMSYVTEGALRLQALIQDLLEFSRVGRNEDPGEPVDCNQVAQKAQDNLRQSIADSAARIECGPLPAVPADQSQLGQVFQNLISNALKFRGASAPVIKVQAERAGNDWLFSVSDNGIGIAPEYAEKIFDVFHRLHTRSEYPGNGIGLAICKKIVEHHGGRIWVESAGRCGSTFKFTLPGQCPGPQGAQA